jgi:hydroxymethylpyrimidine pyrophosphatase-like HAD family hydrolase
MDLDGTLLDVSGTSSPENHEAMRRATDDGIALAIVTGRRRSTFRAERDRFTDFPFRASVSNGAVLLASDNETVERVHPLEWEPVLELFDTIARTVAVRCLAVTVPGEGDTPEVDVPDALIITSAGGYYHAPSPCEPELQEAREENELARASALSRTLVHAALHVPDQASAVDIVRLGEAFCPGAAVYASRPPRAAGVLVHIGAGGGKALAVRDLAASLSIGFEAIGAIGDGVNDVSLLEAVGRRYAIAGSELAAVCPSATRVSGETAVAKALRSFARAVS